jgi:hypothetical protein
VGGEQAIGMGQSRHHALYSLEHVHEAACVPVCDEPLVEIEHAAAAGASLGGCSRVDRIVYLLTLSTITRNKVPHFAVRSLLEIGLSRNCANGRLSGQTIASWDHALTINGSCEGAEWDRRREQLVKTSYAIKFAEL